MKISFLGDIMYESGMSTNPLFELKGLLLKSDYVIGNLETPITRKEILEAQRGECRFIAPVSFAQTIKENGVTHVSVANNHCLDQGVEGLKETMESLCEIGLPFFGAKLKSDDSMHIFLEKDGIRVAIVGSTYGTNTQINNCYLSAQEKKFISLSQEQELSFWLTRFLFKNTHRAYRIWKAFTNRESTSWFDRKEKSFCRKKQLKEELSNIRKQGADYVIAYPHWGGQFRNEPMQHVIKLGKFYFNHGCNLIIGNHEHVIQKCSITRRGVVSYCLGNAVSLLGIDEKSDRFENCSIIKHVYLDKISEREILERITFSIAMTRLRNGTLETRLLSDWCKLCNQESERLRLYEIQRILYRIYTGADECDLPLKEEFELSERKLICHQ